MRKARLLTAGGPVSGTYEVGEDGCLLPPCNASALYCVGRNNAETLDQQGQTALKAFDGSAPLGPWVERELDPRGRDMWTDVGGERRQEANTDLMLFDPYEGVGTPPKHRRRPPRVTRPASLTSGTRRRVSILTHSDPMFNPNLQA